MIVQYCSSPATYVHNSKQRAHIGEYLCNSCIVSYDEPCLSCLTRRLNPSFSCPAYSWSIFPSLHIFCAYQLLRPTWQRISGFCTIYILFAAIRRTSWASMCLSASLYYSLLLCLQPMLIIVPWLFPPPLCDSIFHHFCSQLNSMPVSSYIHQSSLSTN